MDIQAQELAKVGLHEDSIALFDRLIDEDDCYFALASVYGTRAKCFAELGQTQQAIASFRRAIKLSKDRSSFQCGVEKTFGLWVIENKMDHLYGEARDNLIELYDQAPLFPIDGFLQEGILAITQYRLGNEDDAKEHARIALEWASRTQSNAAKHRNLGLVSEKYSKLRNQLVRISENADLTVEKSEPKSMISKILDLLTR